MLTELDAVVFDFDGVINRNYDHDGFLWPRSMQKDLGVDPQALGQALFSGPRFAEILDGRWDLKAALEELLPPLGYRGEVRAFMDYWFRKDLALCPDVVELLRELKAAGATLAIGTNNEPWRATFLWEEAGMGELFEVIYASGVLGVAKPDPEFFRRVQQDLEVADPQRLLFIDDMPVNVRAARQAGWRAHQYGDFSCHRLGDPAELRRLLGL